MLQQASGRDKSHCPPGGVQVSVGVASGVGEVSVVVVVGSSDVVVVSSGVGVGVGSSGVGVGASGVGVGSSGVGVGSSSSVVVDAVVAVVV